MSQTAPPNRNTSADRSPSDADADQETRPRDWKRAVADVASTVTDAAVDAVAIVGDAARTLKERTVGSRQGSEAEEGSEGSSTDDGDGRRDAEATSNGHASVRGSVATAVQKLSSRTRRAHEQPVEPEDVLVNGAGNRAPAAPAPEDGGADDGRGTWGLRPGTDGVEAPWLPPLRERVDHQRSWLVRAATFILATLAGFAAIVVIAVALLPRAAALAAESAKAELILPSDTQFDPLASRTRVFYADGSLLAILHGEQDRNPVSLSKMPDHAWQAIVAEEDRKFFEHEGYDPTGILRALVANFQAGDVQQGGSTITQQVARMNFEEVGLEESIERKIKEVVYAIAVERKFSKEDILNRYVNQVYFGAGTYGLQAASEEFFRKNVVEIDVDEAALLAGLISSPSAYNPRDYPERAEQQRNLVLKNMVRAGYLTEAEGEEYASKPLDIAPPRKGTNKQPSIVEAIMREVKSNPVFGATEQEREDNLFNGGLRITTTINKRLQKLAQKTVEARYPGSDGPTAVIASIHPRTGAVLAAASAKKYNNDNFSLALQGRRQPGSAFKPFVMAEALRQGFSPKTTLDSKSPIKISQPGEDWEVQNYGGASYGPMDMYQATAKSVNTYYAQLMMMVGVEPTVKLVEKMGISQAAFGDSAYPSMVLGGLTNGTTPAEMASAYGVFANNGVHVEPHLLKEVKRGKQSLLQKPKKTQVLDPSVNAVAVDILRGPVSGGTASVSLPNMPVIGKTGTTQLATDAWFVATTPVMSTAVWVGYPRGQIRMPGYTGGGMAAPIWQAYMSDAVANRDPKDFPDADDAEFVGKLVKVPDVQGLTEDQALAKLSKKKLIGRVQHQPSPSPVGTVIWASPNDEAEMGTTVYLGISSGPAPAPDTQQDEGGGDGDGGGGDGGGDDEDLRGRLREQLRELVPGEGGD